MDFETCHRSGAEISNSQCCVGVRAVWVLGARSRGRHGRLEVGSALCKSAGLLRVILDEHLAYSLEMSRPSRIISSTHYAGRSRSDRAWACRDCRDSVRNECCRDAVIPARIALMRSGE